MSDISRIGYAEEHTRWKATVIYRLNETETRRVIHHVSQISELEQLIENGPTYFSIESFKIDYWGHSETIEESYFDSQASTVREE